MAAARPPAKVAIGSTQAGAENSTITLTRTTVSDNAASRGGGICNLFSDGSGTATIVATDSTISGNTTDSSGGGIWNDNSAVVTLTGTTISGNIAGQSGGGFGNSLGTGSLTNCTISGNEAVETAGGIYTVGGTDRLGASFNAHSFGGRVEVRDHDVGERPPAILRNGRGHAGNEVDVLPLLHHVIPPISANDE